MKYEGRGATAVYVIRPAHLADVVRKNYPRTLSKITETFFTITTTLLDVNFDAVRE